MKILYLFIAMIFCVRNTVAQVDKKSVCPFDCSAIPFQDFKEGMEFLFPETASLLETNAVCTEFKQLKACDPDTVHPLIRYKELAGKTFKILKVEKIILRSYPDENYFQYKFTMTSTTCPDTFSYTTVVDKRLLAGKKDGDPKTEIYSIKGGILMAEVTSANASLSGKTVFATFPLNGKKYEQVTITKVEPGTWETPLRIYFSSKNSPHSSVDVNICGTNVPGSFISSFNFSNYFSCESKRGNIPAERWELIQKGKPVLNMSVTEIESMLGKPQKIVDTETKEGHVTDYTYANYQLGFINNILVKISNIK